MANVSNIPAKNVAVNFFDNARSTVTGWFASMGIDVNKLLGMGAVFGIGVLIGFLLKRYFTQMLILLLIIGTVLFFLQSYNYININWFTVKSAVNIQATDTIGKVFGLAFAWLKERILFVISFIIGFIVGRSIE